MATFTKIEAFVEQLAEQAHNLGADTLMLALCAAADAPDPAADSELGDLTEISYTNASSRALTVTGSAQTAGVYKLTIDDLTLSASGGPVGPFQYVVIYNDTHASDGLIGFYDLGSEVTLSDGQDFLFDFDQIDGLLTIE